LINLDTNILVRYVAQDEPRQAAAATRLLEEVLTPASPGHVSLVVLVELAWVLERSYDCGADIIRRAIEGLMAAPNLVVERPAIAAAALAAGGPGFADAIIKACGDAAGCVRTLTFDRRFAEREGVDLLE
jgi:predicted nucleic-acid-binding protein